MARIMMTPRKLNQLNEFKAKREYLRNELLTNSILGQDQHLNFAAEFDGYGDSGSTHAATGNDEVDKLLREAVELFVTFDWYNNEGGGGEVIWDVRKDKIIINGYYNVTNRVEQMKDEVF